jgi:hypothetical protein
MRNGFHFLAPEPRSRIGAIAPAMVALKDAGTFAEVYAKLTGDAAANAWPKFSAAVRALPNGVKNDDPFAGVQPPPPAPSTTPLQLVFSCVNLR